MNEYTNILYYQGFAIAVEHYLYRLAINPTRQYSSMNAMKAEIDRMIKEDAPDLIKHYEDADRRTEET